MRRLPVFVLLDTSGSMRGEPIEAVKNGLQVLLRTLRQDPFALESVSLCLISFDRVAQIRLPLTPLEDVQLPDLNPPESGPTHLGAALALLCTEYDAHIRLTTPTQKGDWMPLLFVLTDGAPSDLALYRAQLLEVRRRGFAAIVACAAGPRAKDQFLLELTSTVTHLDTLDGAALRQYFQWVSAAVRQGSQSMGAAGPVALPPPPPEMHPVI